MTQAETETEMLVLRDGAGTYYRVPRALVEAGRVSDDEQARWEAALGEDTGGFALHIFFPAASPPASTQPPPPRPPINTLSFPSSTGLG